MNLHHFDADEKKAILKKNFGQISFITKFEFEKLLKTVFKKIEACPFFMRTR